MENIFLNIEGLKKKYKSKEILKNINLNINKGEILGLIGKNGAGKTTLLKCINGLTFPTSGKLNIKKNIKVSALIEDPGLFPYLSARQNIKLLYSLYGKTAKSEEINNLLHLVGLKNNNTKIKKYSLGMKQRLGIAITLIGNPDIILLDEPTNGLDPDGIILFRQLILNLNKKGVTFIISSHALDELSKISSRVAFLNNGKIVYENKNEGNLEKLFIQYIMER